MRRNLTLVFMASVLSFSGQALQQAPPQANPTVPPYGPKVKDGVVQNKNLISFSSKEGREWLLTSTHNNDFFELAPHFQPQINPIYCAAATGTIFLNALRQQTRKIPYQPTLSVKRPLIKGHPDWDGKMTNFFAYVQSNFYLLGADDVKSKNIIDLAEPSETKDGKPSAYDPGVTLEQFAAYLRHYGLEVQVKFADQVSAEEFNQDVVRTVDDTDHFMAINFSGAKLGALTFGHVAPLAAVKDGHLLTLDVAGHKNAWYWTPINDMFDAMHTIDDGSKKNRGYLIVSEKK